MNQPTKAISIKQPWASLIAYNIKNIENRTWKTSFRGTVYIHASAKPSGKMIDLLTKEQYDYVLSKGWKSATLKPVSAIIGEVDIVDCVINHGSIWAEQTTTFTCPDSGIQIIQRGSPKIYNWVLENAVLYKEPILNVKGSLSFWPFNK